MTDLFVLLLVLLSAMLSAFERGVGKMAGKAVTQS
jgi:hypothetical protein